jgi:hypothetical protein
MKTLEKKIEILKQLKNEISDLTKLKERLEAYHGDERLRMDSNVRVFDRCGDNQCRVELKTLISPSEFLVIAEKRLSKIEAEAEELENMFSVFEKALGKE